MNVNASRETFVDGAASGVVEGDNCATRVWNCSRPGRERAVLGVEYEAGWGVRARDEKPRGRARGRPAALPPLISLRSSRPLLGFRSKSCNSTLAEGPMTTSTTPQPDTAGPPKNSTTSEDGNGGIERAALGRKTSEATEQARSDNARRLGTFAGEAIRLPTQIAAPHR